METLQTNLERLDRLAETERQKASKAARARDRLLLQGVDIAVVETQQVAYETATASATRFQGLADRLHYIGSVQGYIFKERPSQ